MTPSSPGGLPPGTPENFAWFASWIAEQFGKLEGKLDSLSKEFVTRREIERLQHDIDGAHRKVRELEQGQVDEIEDRVRILETQRASDSGANQVRFTVGERIGAALLAILVAVFMAYLGLK